MTRSCNACNACNASLLQPMVSPRLEERVRGKPTQTPPVQHGGWEVGPAADLWPRLDRRTWWTDELMTRVKKQTLNLKLIWVHDFHDLTTRVCVCVCARDLMWRWIDDCVVLIIIVMSNTYGVCKKSFAGDSFKIEVKIIFVIISDPYKLFSQLTSRLCTTGTDDDW